ncbi:MAG: hypothetical protein GOVbin2277_61 [Prokaryotic dsDNA virus sp.]|nr:MAG: hypothetical protein GOVbin2277_61 [Prokaryotic dsDNA virus sp.]|tara:strand:+ start:428 stop:688 length:261 start_codon:yes stop_codon:yes gene_type:complete
MSYNSVMDFTAELEIHNTVVINGAQLILALEDLGFDDVEVGTVDGGFALFIGGVRIAVGVGDDPAEASENLLDRTADLFYHDIPEA